MADDFMDHIVPIAGSAPIDRLEGESPQPQSPRRAQTIAGRISAVRRRALHHGGGHTLDVTVGASDYTEIVLRVASGTYGNIEGKRAVLYIDE